MLNLRWVVAVWLAAAAAASLRTVAAPAPPGQTAPRFVPPPAPEQPLPFSHRVHAGLGLTCQGCHVAPDPGDRATLPETGTCMACHGEGSAAPPLEGLSAAHATGEAIAWVRVYELPRYVDFSHRTHLSGPVARLACETCHGAVSEIDVMQQVTDISMGACMDCHRETRAPNTCTSCHDQLALDRAVPREPSHPVDPSQARDTARGYAEPVT